MSGVKFKFGCLLFALAIVVFASVPAEAGCSYKQEYFDNFPLYPHSSGNCMNGLLAQSFKPQRNFTLCKVSIVGHGGTNGGAVTLYIQDDPSTTPGTVYTQVTINVAGQTVDAWHTFDVPDIHMVKDQEYYIRLVGDILWSSYQTTAYDPYTRGKAYASGLPVEDSTPQLDWIDHWFIAFSPGLIPDKELKWEQFPDLTPQGIDIRCDRNDGIMRTLADDFECTQTGRIRGVEFWSSWNHDYPDQVKMIHLSIHEDLPVGDPRNPHDYSIPGALKWAMDFGRGEFDFEHFVEVWPQEWFWDPAEGYPAEPNCDHHVYKYTIPIKPYDAFVQEGSEDNPVTYWLDIWVDLNEPEPVQHFGWKTHDPFMGHYMDDAVWSNDDGMTWNELRYPQNHPYYQEPDHNSIELSFRIIGEVEEPNCVWDEGDGHKMHWPQLPDLEPTGVDVDMFWVPLADDWKCSESGLVTDIHFWGSFADDWLPIDLLEGANTLTFNLAIHDDIPAGPGGTTYSMPGTILWERIFTPGQYSVRQVAENDIEDWYDPVTGIYLPGNHYSAFQYNFCIEDDPFKQKKGKIYWLEIKDILTADPTYTFGWKTTTQDLQWNDDATYLHSTLGWQPLYYPDGHEYAGDTLDLAFVITGEPDYIKWSQPPVLYLEPDVYIGWDEWATEWIPKMVMDDFRCDTNEPVTAIRWWGSFENWYDNVVPDDANLPDRFLITIWNDIPASGSSDPVVKWIQPPDLREYYGIDVDATDEQVWQPQVLADDYQCEEQGPITEIIIWGSWYHDYLPYGDPTAVSFTLSIHDDIPASMSPTGYSMPGNILWMKTFWPGEFDVWQFAQGLFEGWYVPCAEPPYYDRYADTICWEYDFYIDDIEAFWQMGEPGFPVTYWLNVQATPVFDPGFPEPIRFGWKTTPPEFHWNDDAVWGLGQDPPAMWYELKYPLGHNFQGQTADLAFAIGSYGLEKWWQPPDLSDYNGIDVDATYEEVWQPQILADDFNCMTTGLITDIHVWGSWYHDYTPEFDANLVSFTLSIHDDLPAGDPANPYDYSIPGVLLWSKDFDTGNFEVSRYAEDLFEGWYVPCAEEPYYEDYADSICWKYDFYIDQADAFMQQGSPDEPVIYWLDVQARPQPTIPGGPPMRSRFGWKTSKTQWNDDAVWAIGTEDFHGPWNELVYPQGHLMEGLSADLAFAITTEPEVTYSHPNEIVWGTYCSIYDVNFYGWEYDPRDPAATYVPKFEFYQELRPEEYWEQPEDNGIYWLGIMAVYGDLTHDPYYPWGWETRPHYFMDDAVRFFDMPQLGIQYPAEDFEPIEFDSNSWDLSFELISKLPEPEVEYGDAPDGTTANPVIAYPSLGVNGWFPTCKTVLPSGYVEHGLGWAHFVNPAGGLPAWDSEPDGDAGLCPSCFPTYDDDECYLDGDAGLIIPEPYTIDAAGAVVPCPMSTGTALGVVCTTAVWGTNVDIWVVNNMPVAGFMNVLADWDQNGSWGGSSVCPPAGTPVPEHVLVNWPVPIGYNGPLSALVTVPPNFTIGPNKGYVWMRFTISEAQVPTDWDGNGQFEDGETEDYLIRVDGIYDCGDAPETGTSYPTLIANGGPYHDTIEVVPIILGPTRDLEPDGQPNAGATGDDNAGIDDEDGVVFATPIVPGGLARVDITASIAGALLNAWVDFNDDGDWDDAWPDGSEQIIPPDSLSVAGLNQFYFNVPSAAVAWPTYARVRITTMAGAGYGGYAPNGEVEDHLVEIKELECDWWGDDPNTKWFQLPDRTQDGMDVRLDREDQIPRVLGDDFKCVVPYPITDIHFWGSWKDDIKGDINSITVSFHDDIPANPPEHSRPGTELWTRQFERGQFEERLYAIAEPNEWWLDPCPFPIATPLADKEIWQYNICIDPEDNPFKQEGDPCEPVVYWLVLRVDLNDIPAAPRFEFGWKTSPEHWNDDAVYSCDDGMTWNELKYPDGHRLEGETADLAFVITGQCPCLGDVDGDGKIGSSDQIAIADLRNLYG
ncbi:MAG: hypothetical protein JXB29_01415, partial [Sedimentisphaerales bacterium]|nr:hypothetical protein [Sedimentisphaerales bacterium]